MLYSFDPLSSPSNGLHRESKGMRNLTSTFSHYPCSREKIAILAAGVFGILLLLIFAVIHVQRNRADIDQIHRTEMLSEDINRHLEKNFSASCKALARQAPVTRIISDRSSNSLTETTDLLNSAREILEASIVYVMDGSGLVVASSRTPEGSTLFGYNYNFRPYFQEALKGSDFRYAALGLTTRDRGIYFSSPIRGANDDIIGVAVIKGGVEAIDNILIKKRVDGPLAVVSNDGVIFASTDALWLFHTAFPMDTTQLKRILDSRQFGDQPLSPPSHSSQHGYGDHRQHGLQGFEQTDCP